MLVLYLTSLMLKPVIRKQHIRSRKLNRIQPTNSPARQSRNSSRDCLMLRKLANDSHCEGSHLHCILRRHPLRRRAERHPVVQPLAHVLLRRTGRGGAARISVLLGFLLQRTQHWDGAVRFAELHLPLLRAMRSGRLSWLPVSLYSYGEFLLARTFFLLCCC